MEQIGYNRDQRIGEIIVRIVQLRVGFTCAHVKHRRLCPIPTDAAKVLGPAHRGWHLVQRSPLIGGTLIKVMDLNDHTIAAASVLTEDGRTRVSFVSDHADRYWYEDLFRRCVAVPNGWR